MSPLCTGPMKPPKSQKSELPPLILHPFDDHDGSMIPEAAPDDEAVRAELTARYAELRMLCFIGKDLTRWLEQAAELATTNPVLAGATEASLIRLLLFDAPAAVIRKMRAWEVGNYQLIFSRALGLNSVFGNPPSADQVSVGLLRNFHAYADALFDARLKLNPGVEIANEDVDFTVYASAEYIALLEKSWKVVPPEE